MEDSKVRPLVLHAVASGGLYGIERMLTMLLPALRETGWDAQLLCFNAAGGVGAEVGERCAAQGCPVHYLPLERGVRMRDLLRIWTALRTRRPQLLHVHGYKATTLAGAVARLQDIQVVGTVHSEVVSAPEVANNLRLESLVLPRLTRVAAVSTGVSADLIRRGVSPHRIEVIRNGITDPGVPESTTRPLSKLVVIGRLVEPKNNHVVLNALAALAQRGIRRNLVVAGDGPERQALRELTSSFGLDEQVQFTGFIDDVGSLLSPDSIFVMPSRSEGIPLALLEAMAHGMPIIASRVGGIPEVVEDGREALLMPPDDPAALEKLLATLFTDEPRARALGAAARLRYEREFRLDAMRDRYTDLYTRVLNLR